MLYPCSYYLVLRRCCGMYYMCAHAHHFLEAPAPRGGFHRRFGECFESEFPVGAFIAHATHQPKGPSSEHFHFSQVAVFLGDDGDETQK